MKRAFLFPLAVLIISGCVGSPFGMSINAKVSEQPTPPLSQDRYRTAPTDIDTKEFKSIEARVKKDFERSVEWNFGDRIELWERSMEELTFEPPRDSTRVTIQFVISIRFGVRTSTDSIECTRSDYLYTTIFEHRDETWQPERYRLSLAKTATPSAHPLCAGE